MDDITDNISKFAAAVARIVYGHIALWMTCLGWGGALAFIAMWDAGQMPGFVVLLVLPLFALLVWGADAQRQRYLKWVRVKQDAGS
jgi:hypothetical protein